jgi:hypothetical protein
MISFPGDRGEFGRIPINQIQALSLLQTPVQDDMNGPDPFLGIQSL